MMVPPGLSLPSRSASSTILAAIRSLMEPPGFTYSSFTRTVALMPSVTWLSLISGVLPIRSRTDWAYFMGTNLPSCPPAGVSSGPRPPAWPPLAGHSPGASGGSLSATGGQVLPQPQDVALGVLEVGVEAHARDGILRLDHGAAELLNRLEGGVDVLHIHRNDGTGQLALPRHHAAVDGTGLRRPACLFVHRRGDDDVVVHLRHGVDPPAESLVIEVPRPFLVVRGYFEMHHSTHYNHLNFEGKDAANPRHTWDCSPPGRAE